MGRAGSARARAALFRSALTACAHPTAQPQAHAVRRWYLRRTAAGMPKRRALLACAGKLAGHLYAIGRSGRACEDRP